MRRLLTAAILTALLSAETAVAAPKEKAKSQQTFAVYYINMQKILNSSVKGKQAKSLLEAKINSAREKIKKMKEEIEKLKKELQSPVLSKEAREKKEIELQQKIRELQRFQQDTQIEISNLEQKYTMEIIQEIVKVVKQYRKEHNIPIIVEVREAGIVAADPKYDLSDKILDIYNKQAGK